MLRLSAAAIVLVLACPVFAAEPSEGSVRELLTVTQVRAQVEGIMGHVEAMMNNTMKQMLGDRPITPEKRKVMESMQSKGLALMRQEMGWETYEPFFVGVYRQHLSQEEVSGLIAFYKSPLGQAVINKLPVLMQAGAAESQRRIGPLIEKLKVLAQETYAELQALDKQ